MPQASLPIFRNHEVGLDKLLKPDEVARLLGVEKSTIYQWTSSGFIPHAKIGRFVRFDLETIKNWVDERSLPGRTTHGLDIRQYGI